MATRIVNTILPTQTGANMHGIDMLPGDHLIVERTGSISATGSGANGVNATGGNLNATIFGSISAQLDGIFSSTHDSRVTVGETGAVFGIRTGVNLAGRNVGLFNMGMIASSAEWAVVSSAQVQAVVENYGTIIGGGALGSWSAISFSASAGYVLNAGLIVGSIRLLSNGARYDGRLGQVREGSINLGPGDNDAWGGSYEDRFVVAHGNSFIDGGGGSDDLTIKSADASVTIDLRIMHEQETGFGRKTIRSIENVFTENGNDAITGNEADNYIFTLGGNDTLEGGLGDDTLAGGSGNDTAVYSGSAGATVDLTLTRPQNTGYGFDTLDGIENLAGGSGSDRFTGDGNANRLEGAGGNDTLRGGGGDDTLDGGSGVNTAVFAGERAQATISRNGDGSLTVAGPEGTDRLYNIRLLQFADRLEVLNTAPAGLALSGQSVGENAPVNSVVATVSATDADGDALRYSLEPGSPFALVGPSLVVAGALDFESARQHSVTVLARDEYGGVTRQTFTLAVTNAVESTPFVLRGGAGADVLAGEAGHDTLYGGAGNDVLTGGAGRDVFVFDTRPNKRTNVDKITDFRFQDDSIYLDNKVFTKLGSGTFAKPKKINIDMFVQNTKAQDAEDRIIYDRTSGKLYYDEDGTGSKAQVQIATLSKNLKMTAGDFFVV